jgi:hypothetical protein
MKIRRNGILETQVIAGAGASGSSINYNPVLISGSDGTNARTLQSDNLGNLRITNSNNLTYSSSNPVHVTTSTVVASTSSLAYLWHPSANTKTIEIIKIIISWSNGKNGELAIGGNFITAENGTPGGTSQTIKTLDNADAASTLTFRTGANAPTRSAGNLFGFNILPAVTTNDIVIFESNINMKPIRLRPSVNEGFEIYSTVVSTIVTGVNIKTSFFWKEI